MEINKAEINLDQKASPIVLAGILGVNIERIYHSRQDGKLPASAEATYRTCIQHYINHYKSKINLKAGTIYEEQVKQAIRNNIAKEHQLWLEIKKTKEELVDVLEFMEFVTPVFQLIKASLLNISRKYPETTKDIDRCLETLYNLGERIALKAKLDGDAFVQEQLDKEFDFSEAEQGVENKFGLADLE